MKTKTLSYTPILFCILILWSACKDDADAPLRFYDSKYEVPMGGRRYLGIESGNGDYSLEIGNPRIASAGIESGWSGVPAGRMIYISGILTGSTYLKVTDNAPQETLTQGSRQCHTVGKVQFHLQRQGTAVHKGIAVFQSGPVIEFFIGPVYRLISGQCRSSKIEEEHFSRIGKEIQVISAFCRKLRRRDGHMTVTVFHMQVFRSIYPFVPAFGIT